MVKKAVIYTRVSTEEQGDNFSLPTQKTACFAYANQHEFNVVDTLEDRQSGTNLDRPELNRLKAMAGKIDVAIFYTQDRFSRADRLQTLLLATELEQHGIEVHLTDTGRVDTRSFLGQLQLMLKAEAAREESRKFGERSTRGKRGKALSGEVVRPSMLPYGYDWDEENQTYKIIEEQAVIIRQMYHWYVHGDETGKTLGYQKIANRLTEMGIPTPMDMRPLGKIKRRNYGVWGCSSVGDIISNPLYKGIWTYNRFSAKHDEDGISTKSAGGFAQKRLNDKSKWVEVPIPSIVSEDLWERAREQAAFNINKNKRNSRHPYLFRYVMRCAKCGYKLIGQRTPKYRNKQKQDLTSEYNAYYVCDGARSSHAPDNKTRICSGGLRHEFVDELLWSYIAFSLRHPESILEMLQSQREQLETQTSPLKNRLEQCEQNLKEIDAKRERILSLYVDNLISKDEVSKRLGECENQKHLEIEKQQYLQKQIELLGIEEVDTESIRLFCEQVGKGIDSLTFEEKQQVIETLRIEVLVHRGKTPEETVFTISGFIPKKDITMITSNPASLCRGKGG